MILFYSFKSNIFYFILLNIIVILIYAHIYLYDCEAMTTD